MNQTEQLLKVGRAYIDALNKLDRNQPEKVAHILDILDCVHPEPGCHLGIYIEKPSPNEAPSHMCDQAWFICCRDKHSPIKRIPYRKKTEACIIMGICAIYVSLFISLIIYPLSQQLWELGRPICSVSPRHFYHSLEAFIIRNVNSSFLMNNLRTFPYYSIGREYPSWLISKLTCHRLFK